MTRVSVIIPAYNQSQYIAEAIESVLTQTFQDFQVIVVDDGSTDDTRQVVARFKPRVRYVYQENRGESGARNTGIRLATGEFLAFLDADDTFARDKLERQVEILETHPQIGLTYSDVYVRDETERQNLFSLSAGLTRRPSGFIFEALVRRNLFTVNSVLVRREILNRVGLFDESLPTFPDWDLWLRIAAHYEFFYADVPLAYYRVHSNMVSRNQSKMWLGALAVRRKLTMMPAFQACSPSTQQYCYYQLGLLNCLAGEMTAGRRYLWRAFRRAPRQSAAGLAWGLSLLGKNFLRAIVAWRAKRRGWADRL